MATKRPPSTAQWIADVRALKHARTEPPVRLTPHQKAHAQRVLEAPTPAKAQATLARWLAPPPVAVGRLTAAAAVPAGADTVVTAAVAGGLDRVEVKPDGGVVVSKDRNAFDALRPSDEPLEWAALYEWILDKIDPEHPLFGITYVGQICRAGKVPEKAFDERTREHETNAARESKEVGLHAAVDMFGTGAFTKRLIPGERKHAPRTQAMAWANEREIALIAERGGVLRDMDRRLQQTLNLTAGGQGDAIKSWQSIAIRSEKRWLTVRSALAAFHDREGHLNVPQDHEERGMALGSIVNGMRSNKSLLPGHPDRQAWLDARGWIGNMYEARWRVVQDALLKFYQREGHLHVPSTYTVGDLSLGRVVVSIRTRDDFLVGHPERRRWLHERGWVRDARHEHWIHVRTALESFYKREGHLCVPYRHVENGIRLGCAVKEMRCQGTFLKQHQDRKAWVEARGWISNAREHRWLEVKASLQSFFNTYGHLRVPYNFKANKLGQIVKNMRNGGDFIAGHPERAVWLKEHGFVLHTKDAAENKRRWALHLNST